MAINIRCQNCKNEVKLSARKCKKCNKTLPKNKTYKVTVRMDGRKITKTVRNLELAKEIESKLKVNKARNEFDINKKTSIKLNDFFERYYLPWATENKKSWKEDNYYYRKHLAPRFGEKTMDMIAPIHIEKLKIDMKKTKNVRGKFYADATIKHQLILLSRLFSLAIKWGYYTGDNPCQKVEKPKLNNQKNEYLNDNELGSLLETLETWPNKMTSAFIKFALFTGLRRGEMFKLTWNDIDNDRLTMTIRDPKGKQNKILPLSNKAFKVLQQIPKEYETPFIFYGKNGKQRKDFKGTWQRIRKAAGLPENFRLHGLRHHFASALVNSGFDLYTVQNLLTHKQASTTQRYAHLQDKALRDAVNYSDKLFAEKTDKQVIALYKHKG